MAISPAQPGPEQPGRSTEENRSTHTAAAGPPSRAGSGGVVAALILIALGLFFLAANLYPVGGGSLFLGLGAAFLVARVATGRYGFAVPAGLLLGFGAFVSLEEARLLPGDSGAWFFVLLGLGFLGAYVIGARPGMVWPLYPAVALVVFGALLSGAVTVAPLAPYAWLANFWPLVLIGLGLWLLAKGGLPERVAGPLGAVLLMLIVLYAVVTAGALAAAAERGGSGVASIWPSLRGLSPETSTLEAPISPGDTLRVVNTSGQTTIRPGAGDNVRVAATTMTAPGQPRPEVQFTRGAGVLILETIRPGGGLWGGQGWQTDYVVEVPSGARVEARSTSGDIQASSLSGAIRLDSTSGDVAVDLPSGPADAEIRTTSGDVEVRFAPDASARLDVRTSSGDIDDRDVELRDRRQDRRTLNGSLGSGSGLMRIETTSGDIELGTWR